MVSRSLGSGMVSRAVFQKAFPSLGISEKSMSLSRMARNRLKFVAPFDRVPEMVCVVFPFIFVCPPGRDNSLCHAAHNVNHHNLDISHETDGEHAIFAVATLSFLKDRS